MKALLPLLLAAACWGQVIQSSAGVSSGTVTTCVFPNSVVSGDIIVATSEWFSSASTPSVSDTLSTSFTQVEYKNAGPFAGAYVGTATSGGSDTVTFSVSGSSFQNTQCAEFSPTYMTATRGQHSNSATSGSPASVSLNLTTTINGEVLFGVVGGFRSASSFGPNPSTANTVTGTNGADSGAVSYRAAGSAGTYAVGFNNAGSDQVTLLAFSLVPPSGITITSPATIPDAISGTAYSWQLGAVGGTASYTWSITAGTLQTGLSISGGGLISGTPSATGSKTVTVSVTDGTSTQVKSITIGVGTSFQTITQVQHAFNSGATVAFGSSVTAGNTIIVNCVLASGSVLAVIPVTDTLGTPFRFAGALGYVGGTNWDHSLLYYGVAPSSGSDTAACHNPSPVSGTAGSYDIMAAEVSGLFSALDVLSVTTGSGLTSGTLTSSTLTPSVANEYFFSMGSGYTALPSAVSSPFTAVRAVSVYKTASDIVSSTSGITAAYTISGNTQGTWGIQAISFPAAATSIPVNTFVPQVGVFVVGP